jgi:hypothetical protein
MDENTNINVNGEAVENTTSTNEETKTFTQEEVLKLLQQEGDRRVSEALKKAQKKHDKELSLSRLDGDEREKAEKDNKIAELEEKLAQYEIEKNKSELKSVLASRGLSAEFADIILISDDIEASQANIDKLDRLFKKAVQIEVEKRLAGNAPKGNAATSTELTRETAKKLSLAEMNALAEREPEKFNKLYNL